ncbi:MAG: hypothetical protein ACK41T_09170, partial [Pseudobdellovibrio sp.]
AFGESLGFIGYGLASSGFMLYVVLIISSVFWASHPAIQSLITKEIPPEKQGELQGALMSLMSLTAVINPLLMTRVFAHTSTSTGLIYLPGAAYYLAGVFGLIAFTIIWRWEKLKVKNANTWRYGVRRVSPNGVISVRKAPTITEVINASKEIHGMG